MITVIAKEATLEQVPQEVRDHYNKMFKALKADHEAQLDEEINSQLTPRQIEHIQLMAKLYKRQALIQAKKESK